MTLTETCAHFADLAARKARAAKTSPVGFFVASMLAGAYVGIALILAYTTAAGLPAGVRPLVEGSMFGIGLILVLLAGAEMFTGHVMYETFGVTRRTISLVELLKLSVMVWCGNLAGAALLAFVFAKAGGLIFTTGTFLHDIVTTKETSPWWTLLCKAMLCNWMVCMAIWLAARLKSETAKIIGIAWCLLAFVACGFEHSVANMTAVCLGLFAPTPIGDIAHAAYNLGVVSFGNFIGGALFVTGAYSLASRSEGLAAAAPATKPEPQRSPRSGPAKA